MTTTTTDAGARVYYKLTLWAWRLRWAKNRIVSIIGRSMGPMVDVSYINKYSDFLYTSSIFNYYFG